jgi:hypothetical protein
VLGTLLDEVATRKRPLDRDARQLLAGAAGFYLGGTRAYAVGKRQLVDQYVVIRYEDVKRTSRMLRPAATHEPGPLTPQQISGLVLTVLDIDRTNYPERFRRGEPLRFSPKSFTPGE